MYKFTKRTYRVRVYRPPPGTHVYNFLEDAHYTVSEDMPYVIIGTMGEQWPVSEETLLSQYDVVKSSFRLIKENPVDLFTKKTPDPVWAELRPIQLGEFTLRDMKGNRQGVDHMFGDFIVCPNKDGEPDKEKSWIVNGVVFFRTYQVVTT